MSNKPLSIRFVFASIILFAIALAGLAASFGEIKFLRFFEVHAEKSTAVQPQNSREKSVATIGTCDTAGPIEIESSGGTTTPTAYATLKDSFDAINLGTHTGVLNVEVCGNTTESATASLDASGVGTTSYTSITVRPVGGQRIIEGTIAGAIIKLNGADNVTIDGRQGGTGSARDLTVRNNSTATLTAAIWLASVAAGNGAANNTVRNLELAGGATQNTLTVNTFGIIMCGITIGTTVNGVDNDNNSFRANRIIRARYGIVTRGTTTDLNISPVVADNIIGPTAFGADEIGKVGIFMQADTGALVSRNTVQFVGGTFATTTGGSDRVGIGIGQESWSMTPATLTSNTYTITRNVIHDIIEERTFSSVGLLLATTGGGSNTNNLVANNFIYNVKANGTVGDQAVGLGIAGGLGDRVVFNSVSMTGDVDPDAAAVATTNFSSGIRVGNNSGGTHGNLTLTNNSVYMDLSSSSTATIRNYAISGNAAAFNWGTGSENYNNYFINPVNTQLQTGGLGTVAGNTLTTQFATLANWQTAYTTPAAQDANSIQTDPLHVSTTMDLHIAVASPNVNAGNTVTGVTRDIDNQIRVAAPDIGADEPSGTAPAANDIEATTILVPANGAVLVTGTPTTPQARFTNVGTATQTGRMVTFTITGPGGYNYSNTQTIASIAVDEAVTVTFATTPTFTMVGTYTMTASTAADSNTANDSTMGTFNTVAPFSGSYNVGTGETFTSLTNPGGIFAAINTAGATGNVVINITSDLTGETGAVTLNEIASPFTLTIRPSGAARTISGAAPAAGGLLGFNSTDRVTIDGSLTPLVGNDRSLTIMPTNTTNNGGGIYFASGTNGAQNNVIKNVNIFGNGSTTGVLLGVTFAGTTFGAVGIDNDNNRIENCDIRGAFYGIASLGASAANKDTGLVITKNVMPNTGAAGIGRVGIYIFSADGAQITENNIASVANPGAVDTVGIAAGSQALAVTPLATGTLSNALISRNYIGVVGNNSAQSSAGILVASDVTGTNTVVNNMVTGVTGNADTPDIVAGIYVNGLAGSTQNIYHNSVSMTGDRLPVTANMMPSYAMVIATDQPTNVRDNALFNSQTHTGSAGGGGESYAIGFDGPAANVNLLSNNNDLFVSGALGQIGITGDLTTAAQTPAGTGTNQTTLAAWQAATTEDAASISVDPLFTSLTDLHIPMGSPLVNAGADVMVTTDFDGQTRDAMRDIGADEFVVVTVPGSLQFSNATYSGGEAGSPFTVTVTRTGGSDGTVMVNYATSTGMTNGATGGAACTAGVDYINNSGTLTFIGGDTSETFNVVICNDTADEPDETINYTLTMATGGATIGTPNPAVQTIVDDDVPAMNFNVAISDARITEGNAGMANLTFTVTLTSAMMSNELGSIIATVQYATANGTATVGSDYSTTSGTLAFGAPGTLTVNVPITGDTNKESNEFFFVNLTMPSMSTTITDNQGAGIIVDNDRPYVGDFDRDLKADYSVFRPSELLWYVLQSSNSMQRIVAASPNGNVPVPGDYDGDGRTDHAIFDGSSGNWFILRSSDSSKQVVNWGTPGDKPVQGDYDGDGKADVAVFRPSTGTWWVIRSSDSSTYATSFGINSDKPVQGDYDGDAKTDIAVYRDGTWYILQSSTNMVSIQNWGNATDKPVSGDFDGDGRYDLAIYRNGEWWIFGSLNGTPRVVSFGLSTDIPAPADFDGDGTTDVAVFRPSVGDWFVLRSSDQSLTGVHWGVSGDVPIPSAYLPQ